MRITLKKRKLRTQKYSLYIETYKGSITDEKGKRKHIRETENLKLYLHINPSTAKQRIENENNMRLAEKIHAIRLAEYAQGKYGIVSQSKRKHLFLDYFMKMVDEKGETTSSKNHGIWKSVYRHLEICIPSHTTFQDLNIDFVKDVRKYFDNKAVTKSNTKLSLNTKCSYFNKFKACLRKAYKDNYTLEDLSKHVKSFEQAESQREYLTFEELTDMANAYCKYEVLKKAFLFSCLTGIRWSDINDLVWGEIRDEEEGVKILFRQNKTNRPEYLYISDQARALLPERKTPLTKVFTGLKYGAVYNTELLRWANRAGITKHITFHSARHTFAVLQLENGTDIYTLSKLLGHSEIRTTQVYAKIRDVKMKESVAAIPQINFNI